MERARGGVPSVGVVKRRVLRGLWRRLVGVGIIGPGLLGAPAFILHCWPRCPPLPTSTTRPSLCASSALRRSVCGATMTTPVRRAQHFVTHASDFPVLGASASIMGSELLQAPLWGSDSSLCPCFLLHF